MHVLDSDSDGTIWFFFCTQAHLVLFLKSSGIESEVSVDQVLPMFTCRRFCCGGISNRIISEVNSSEYHLP